jgi:hypothetical protein
MALYTGPTFVQPQPHNPPIDPLYWQNLYAGQVNGIMQTYSPMNYVSTNPAPPIYTPNPGDNYIPEPRPQTTRRKKTASTVYFNPNMLNPELPPLVHNAQRGPAPSQPPTEKRPIGSAAQNNTDQSVPTRTHSDNKVSEGIPLIILHLKRQT